jgi:CubicO group peptidase (beta-lactamase class C family)
LFDGAIVVAGYPHPPWPPWNTEENDMNTYIGQARELPFLVIHGPNDPQLSIEATDRFVDKLEKEVYDVVYHRPEGGGHTNMDVTSLVNAWLDERFGQAPTAAPLTQTIAPARANDAELGTIDEAVDQQIRTLMAEGDMPSLSAGIVVNDELVWAKNYDGPAELDSVYIVGSIQKPFTASAVLQLVEQGVLAFDEDVSAYVPFQVRHPDYPDSPITIRSLLTHQSGLGAETGAEAAHVYRGDDSVFEFGEELLGIEFPRLDPYPPCGTLYEGLLTPGGVYYEPDVWEFEPGTVHYSNTGFQFLGCIVEQVTGQSLAEYIEEHIFDPLEMDHSGYSALDLQRYHALPYERIESGVFWMDGQKVPIRDEYLGLVKDNLLELPLYEHVPGAGGLRTTVPDLAQFLIAHMNQGIAPGGHKILHPETVETMHQAAGPTDGNINSFSLVGQGMGWSLCKDGVEGHVGGQLGFGGTMVTRRGEQGAVGVLLMTNVDLMFLDDNRRGEWFTSYYFELEQLLLQTAERMLSLGFEG